MEDIEIKNQLILEIDHIFDSGANEIRLKEMFENFLNKHYPVIGEQESAEEILERKSNKRIFDYLYDGKTNITVEKALEAIKYAGNGNYSTGFLDGFEKGREFEKSHNIVAGEQEMVSKEEYEKAVNTIGELQKQLDEANEYFNDIQSRSND